MCQFALWVTTPCGSWLILNLGAPGPYDQYVRVATWNLERRKPTTPRGVEAVDYLHAREADIAVVTEVRTTFPVRGGNMIFAEKPDPPRFADDERKIGIWSRTVLESVEFDSPIDPTRFIAARTATTAGPILILGVCIPWHMAGVKANDGPKTKMWEQHLTYLDHLTEIFAVIDEPMVVAGDFNQRYPRQKQSRKVAEALEATFNNLDILTAGIIDGCARHGIDHIAISPHLEATSVSGWPHDATGNRLSDHDGAMSELEFR